MLLGPVGLVVERLVLVPVLASFEVSVAMGTYLTFVDVVGTRDGTSDGAFVIS